VIATADPVVECLNCFHQRQSPDRQCPLCGYVGWAWSTDLDADVREELRVHPPARRRLRHVG
jgi:hypothetical protein